jgi:hypothetical protein
MIDHPDTSHFAPMKKCRVAFFEPHRDLSTNPSLMCIIDAMAGLGWDIDIFMPPHSEFPPIPSGNVHRYPFPARPPIILGRMKQTWNAWIEFIRTKSLRRHGVQCAYHLVFGIDSAGIIAASGYAQNYAIPLVYLSYEIIFSDELKGEKWIKLKQNEKNACRTVDLVIVQDQHRAKLLSDEISVDLSKFELLPVAPSKRVAGASDYLRNYFKLSKEKTIVLHSGSFAKWTCAENIIQSMSTWPDDFILVIHTRYKPTTFDPFIRFIRKNRPPNVYLSAEPFSEEEYQELVASADIGLALYQPDPSSPYTGRNIENVGLSSGKFSLYMKFGLPTITTAQPVYRALLERYNFGEVLTDVAELPQALRRIRANLNRHREDAKRLFEEQLDFNLHWPRVTKRIRTLLKEECPL